MTSLRGPNPDAPRVVVTGLGLITALGTGVEKSWRGLVAGRSGVRTIQSFDPSRVASKMAGEVPDFDASGVLDKKDMRRIDRYIQFGLVAAREAMDMAGLPARLGGRRGRGDGRHPRHRARRREHAVRQHRDIRAARTGSASPFLVPMGIANVGAGQIAIAFGPLGPNFATVSACASSGARDRRGIRDDPPR